MTSSSSPLSDLLVLLLPIFRSQRPYCCTCPPHFRIADGGKFLIKLFTIIRSTIGFKGDSCFVATQDGCIEFIKDWCHRIAETRMPVQRAALRSRGTIGVHEVHAFLAHKPDQRLSQFLDSFIKGFARTMTMFAQNIVLGLHES